jgi:alpha-beta hydrolase superfamily lysophospholipase
MTYGVSEVARASLDGGLDSATVTQGVWIGPADRPLAGWLTRAKEAPPVIVSGVLLLPPVGYEYWTAHRTMRVLAERVASVGHMTLRIDYDGVGDSGGDQSDPERWDSWRAAVAAGVSALRSAGAERVVLVGLRLGATIALLEAADLGVDTVVAAMPVVVGRKYAGELAMMSTRVPDPAPQSVEPGAIVNAGTVFLPETIRALSAIDLSALEVSPARRVLLLDREDSVRSEDLASRLDELGCDVDYELVEGVDVALDRPTEDAEAASELIARVAEWLGPADVPNEPPYGGSAAPVLPACTTMEWHGGVVREQFVRLGSNKLAAVRTWASVEPSATLVLLNSGSEPHVGPGRAWVELSRALALHGFQVFRVDFRGWGESPDGGYAPGRPYDAHAGDDVAEIVDVLRLAGNTPVFLAGICAGAWVALDAATRVALDGVIAINPQLYWQPGDPVEALMTDTRRRRLSEIEDFKARGRELERTEPHPVAAWLQQLVATPVPTLMLSSEGDDGLEFLESRLPETWASALASGVIELVTVPIDHALHRYWERAELVSPVVQFLNSAMKVLQPRERW